MLTLAYLIIIFIKLQNWRLSLWLTCIAILPFIRGRNLLEITLIPKDEIWGLAIYDVKYYWPLYLTDLFLLLVYQSYFSNKFRKKHSVLKIEGRVKVALSSLLIIFIVVASKGLFHQYASFMFFSSFLILKYSLLFFSPQLIKEKNKISYLTALISSNILFQSLIIIIEQIKGGNLGKFIENSSVENLGTASAESINLLRANGTFDEANVTAIFLLMGLTLILPTAIKSLKNKVFHFYLLVSAISLLAIVLTGSRSLYFLTACYCLWQYLKNRSLINHYLNLVWKFTALKIFVIGLAILMLPYFWQRLKSLPDAFTPHGSFSYRLELNKHSMLLAKEQIYFGIGLDMTAYYLVKTFKTVDALPVVFDQAPAHNILIQLVTEVGVIGLLAFLIFLASVWQKAFKNKHWPNNQILLASLVFFLAAQFHPVFSNHSELTGFFFLYLGLTNDKK